MRSSVRLSQLNPLDVGVELYGGVLDADQVLSGGGVTPMQHVGVQRSVSQFVARVRFQGSGLRGYTLRVLPRHEDLETCFVPGRVVWGSKRLGNLASALRGQYAATRGLEYRLCLCANLAQTLRCLRTLLRIEVSCQRIQHLHELHVPFRMAVAQQPLGSLWVLRREKLIDQPELGR